MKLQQRFELIKNLLKSQFYELMEENIDDDDFRLCFIKFDFKIDIFYDTNLDLFLTLDRLFYGFTEDYKEVQDDIEEKVKEFIQKIEDLISQEMNMQMLTQQDCELFLKTGSYDGMASGVIEYQKQLYYIKSITNPYFKYKCKKDEENNVWRIFYLFELDKQELEKIIMCSLDWMRHINLSTLCKDWDSGHQKTGTEDEHKKHFNGQYRYVFEPNKAPVKKLVLLYKKMR